MVVKLADANSISVVDAVKHKIDQLNTQLPPGTHLNLVIDASTYTSKSFLTVRNALIEAVLADGLDPAAVPAHLAQHADRAGVDPGLAAVDARR